MTWGGAPHPVPLVHRSPCRPVGRPAPGEAPCSAGSCGPARTRLSGSRSPGEAPCSAGSCGPARTWLSGSRSPTGRVRTRSPTPATALTAGTVKDLTAPAARRGATPRSRSSHGDGGVGLLDVLGGRRAEEDRPAARAGGVRWPPGRVRGRRARSAWSSSLPSSTASKCRARLCRRGREPCHPQVRPPRADDAPAARCPGVGALFAGTSSTRPCPRGTARSPRSRSPDRWRRPAAGAGTPRHRRSR